MRVYETSASYFAEPDPSGFACRICNDNFHSGGAERSREPAGVIQAGRQSVVGKYSRRACGDCRKSQSVWRGAQRRPAGLGTRESANADWHALCRLPEIHLVKMPGGDRTQLTFFLIARTAGTLARRATTYFTKDIGGGEWFQIYRYDIANGNVTLLTDGKSTQYRRSFAHNDNRIAYSSTRRTGQDTDIWVMDPTNPKSDKMLLQLEGGGWDVADWSPDNKNCWLLREFLPNQSYLWLADVATGEKKLLTPKTGGEEVAYGGGTFSKDGKGFYTTTDRESEFQRLAYFDLTTMKPTYLTTDIKWDVDDVTLSDDGKLLAFVTNEDGISKVYLMNTASGKYHPVCRPAYGTGWGTEFHKNNRDLGFVVTSARSTSDVYSLDVVSSKVERWTSSETGGLNTAAFAEPQLIKWQSFDGKTISGFLYMPGRNQVSRQAAGDGQHSWRPGGAIPSWISGKK